MYEPQKKYALKNPQRVKEWIRKWRESHKKERSEYNRKWKKANRGKVRESGRKHWKKIKGDPVLHKLYLEKNRERYRENYLKNSEIIRQRRYGVSSDGVSRVLRFEILKRDNFTCQYCGRKAPEVILHIDHIIPRSKGGKSNKENLVVSCYECNGGKSNNLI